MTSANKNWAARDETKGKAIPLAANGITLTVIGTTEDATVTVNIWLYSKNGPAEWVAGITFTVGAMDVVEDPTTGETSAYLYADTLTFDDQEWPNDKIRRYDYDGNDGLAQVKFDGEGNEFLKVEISAISAGSAIPIFRYW